MLMRDTSCDELGLVLALGFENDLFGNKANNNGLDIHSNCR